MDMSEPDWKAFKEVRATALDRFYRRVLDEARAVCDDGSASARERYRKLYDLIHKRDTELADAFDDVRRSTAIMRLMAMRNHNLVTPEELERFSLDIRSLLASFDD